MKKVKFSSEVTIHIVPRGEPHREVYWEIFPRDRERFSRRVKQFEVLYSNCNHEARKKEHLKNVSNIVTLYKNVKLS